MKKYTVALVATLLMTTACEEKSQSSHSGESSFSIKLKNNTSSASSFSAMNVESPIPLWFGQVQIAAYYYHPSQSHQIGSSFNGYTSWTSPNWSRWQMLAPNQNGARNIFLGSGGSFDLHKMSGERLYEDVTSDYISNVGAFSMDIVEVRSSVSMINDQNVVCGPWYIATGSASDFPFLNFQAPCAQRFVKSSYDGSFLWGRTTFFIRKDWFSSPVQLYVYGDSNSQSPCFKSDVPLTAFQAEIMSSFLKDWENRTDENVIFQYSSACTQANEPISIVPQDNETTIIQFNEQFIPQETTLTEDGTPIPTSPQKIISQNIEMSVGYRVLPSMLVDYNSFNDSNNSSSDILLSPDSTGSPWGASIHFRSIESNGLD